MTLKCDFCSSLEGALVFEARDFAIEPFSINGLMPGSKGDWLACALCAQLVAAHKWEALAERATDTFITRHPELARELAGHRQDLIDQFHVVYATLLEKHLTGHVRPYKKGEQ